MDLITLALAKQYTDSQRLGYVEGQEPIIWDGDTTGKSVIELGAQLLVQIAPEVLDLTTASRVVARKKSTTGDVAIIDAEGGKVRYEYMEHLGIGSLSVFNGDNSGASLVFSCALVATKDVEDFGGTGINIPKGTYLVSIASEDGDVYTNIIEFSENIHHINQRLIPALDSLTLNGADGKQYKLTVDKNGALVHTAIT